MLTMHYSKQKISQEGAQFILENELVYITKHILKYGLTEPSLSAEMQDYNEQFSLLKQCVSLVSIDKDRLEISCRSIFTIANVSMSLSLTRQTEFSQ